MCATSSTHIDFCWLPIHCGSRHGGNLDYEYELTTPTETLPVNGAVFTPVAFCGITGVRVSGLKCGTQYVIYVTVTNNAGSGPSSAIEGVTETGKLLTFLSCYYI